MKKSEIRRYCTLDILFHSRKIKFIILFSGILLCSGRTSFAQYSDTLRFNVTDSILKPVHSPTRAAILSAVFPGMGQVYNKKYWKLILVYGGLGAFGYFVNHWDSKYNEYLNGYINFSKYHDRTAIQHLKYINQIVGSDQLIIDNLRRSKDQYRRWRDLNALGFLGIYILNIVDATVDAYFFNYDISNDLSLKIRPTLLNSVANSGTFGIKLCFTIR